MPLRHRTAKDEKDNSDQVSVSSCLGGNTNLRVVGVEIVGVTERRPERRLMKVRGVSTDSRALLPGELFFALPGRRVDGHDFAAEALRKGAAAVVVSRDVAIPHRLRERLILVPDTLRALGDSAREYRRTWGGMVIAVTGSNGKTTTREMTHHILSAEIPCRQSPRSFNTDVGVPLTLFLLDPRDKAGIVEMGANAPGEIAALAAIAEPNVGMITNIAETHLEGLGSVEGVARAKGELLRALGRSGVAFLNADDDWFDRLVAGYDGRVISFGLSPRAMFRGRELRPDRQGYAFTVAGQVRVRLRVPGRHNVFNALAALALAHHLGLDLAAAAERLGEFRLPEMRYQVEHVNGITVVSDCYNANPGSMRAALQTFRETSAAGRRLAILGDMLELGQESERLHRSLGTEVARSGVDALWAVGRYAEHVIEAAKRSGLRAPVFQADDVASAAPQVLDFLKPGDTVLVKGSRGMHMEKLLEGLRTPRDQTEGCEGGKA